MTRTHKPLSQAVLWLSCLAIALGASLVTLGAGVYHRQQLRQRVSALERRVRALEVPPRRIRYLAWPGPHEQEPRGWYQ